jgi:enoyl-CoA hydratase/carnithine racemase
VSKGYGELVLLEKGDNGVGTITLNRPEKRNAMSKAAQAELRAALEDSKHDCKVIVLTGSGPAFCSGIDLREQVAPERKFSHGSNSWVETNEAVRRHPAVFVGAINGFALGGGLTLVHNCSVAIASEQAQFGMPELGFATFPGLAGPATIRRVLPKHAAYMILTASRVDAQTAEKYGIVNSVVPHDKLLDEAHALANHIAQFDPVVLDYSKRAIFDLDVMPWSEGLQHGSYVGTMIRSETKAAAEALERFDRGERNPGQGVQ